jgi:hypothetical protein
VTVAKDGSKVAASAPAQRTRQVKVRWTETIGHFNGLPILRDCEEWRTVTEADDNCAMCGIAHADYKQPWFIVAGEFTCRTCAEEMLDAKWVDIPDIVVPAGEKPIYYRQGDDRAKPVSTSIAVTAKPAQPTKQPTVATAQEAGVS